MPTARRRAATGWLHLHGSGKPGYRTYHKKRSILSRRRKFRTFRKRSKAALVLQRLFRRKRGRMRRPPVSGRRVYRLHQQLSHQQVMPLKALTEENFVIPKVDFLDWNSGSPVPTSATTATNMVIFGFHLGPTQPDMFPGFQALGGLDPKEHYGANVINRLHYQDEDQRGDDIQRGHDHSREVTSRADPLEHDDAAIGPGMAAATFDAHAVAHAALEDSKTIINPMVLSRYYHLGMTKMQWKIQMKYNRKMSSTSSSNVTDAFGLNAVESHHYEFRRIVFAPKRIVVHPGTSAGYDVKHTHITQAQMEALNAVATTEAGDVDTKALHTDHYNQFSGLTDYFPFADWRYTLFLGPSGHYWGPGNAKTKFMERMYNTGRVILRATNFETAVNVASAVFNTVAGYQDKNKIGWRSLFPNAGLAAQAILSAADLTTTLYQAFGGKSMLQNFQEVIDDNLATQQTLQDEIDHMRKCATKEARESMFIAPINKKHFKVFSDRKFKMKGANVFKDTAASTKTWSEVKRHFRRIDRLHPRQNTKMSGTLYLVRCVDDFNTEPTEFTVSMRGITTFATGC